MTEEEMQELLLCWARAKGGAFTDEEIDSLAAVLEEHFPGGSETATLEAAKKALRLA